ncbi:Annexin a13 [Thalictrum thalictroides]|uniref:Annexin a13 n=1 Tax=Thalictrum thalictroides TaxID=46969 RepID=A0A7J6WQC9_THATH|nr:Annexin a13 [Thalictrum thalictroides]
MAYSLNSLKGGNWKNKDYREISMQENWRGRLNDLVLPLAFRRKLEQIKETCYGGDLINLHLHKTDWSNQGIEMCTLLSLWLLDDPHERDAITAKNAFENGDINYKALIEIYCGRKSSHVLLIKQAYQTMFKQHLEQDIINAEPSSPYQRILIALVTSHKSHHTDVSQHIAKCDARRLYGTGEGRPGAIEESVVLEIFSKRSISQLKLTFSTYKQIYGHDYAKSLKKEINGEFGNALRIIVKCLNTPLNYYAKILYASIKGSIADKSAVVRVIMCRAAGIEIGDIRRIFKTKYGMELKDAICQGISNADCREFLVAIAS